MAPISNSVIYKTASSKKNAQSLSAQGIFFLIAKWMLGNKRIQKSFPISFSIHPLYILVI